jgi:hypothetical protein
MVEHTDEYPTLQFTFPGKSDAQQGQLADELKAFLDRKRVASATLEVTKLRKDTQDLGAIVTVVVSSTALAQLIKGAFDFAQKKASRVEIVGPKGRVVASGDAASGIDVARATEAVAGLTDPHK